MPDYIMPNFTAAFASGQALGRQLRQQKISDNALAAYANGDTSGGVQQLMTVDPDAAMKLQDRQRADELLTARKQAAGQAFGGDFKGAQQTAAGAGDFDLLSGISKLDDQQKQVAADHASTIAAIGIKMRDQDPSSWGQTIDSLTPALLQRGFSQGEIEQAKTAIVQGGAPALDALINQAMTLKDAVAYHNSLATQAETQRHNKAMEARPTVASNGAIVIDPATGDVIAKNPKVFAPPRGKSSGAVGSADAPPPGFVLD
jgi:hypothetical protein